LVEKYLLDYININLPADKVDEAIKLTSNLIEFQNSLKEIENNYKNINFSESEGIKWLAKLKFDLRETFVQKDGISLYATTE
jgi:chemotaxis protein histidine kinase CheA